MIAIFSMIMAAASGIFVHFLLQKREQEKSRLKWLSHFSASEKRNFVFLWLFPGCLVLWVHNYFEKKERFLKMRRDLPLVMDLLAISVAAGMEMMQAIQKIAAVFPKEGIVEEFNRMLHELRLGKTRKEALLSLKTRAPLPEIKTLVSFLVQAIRLGTSLGPVLVASADQMRTGRFLDAEKMGIKAAQKILFPMIFCIFPSVFLTLFAPLTIRFFKGEL